MYLFLSNLILYILPHLIFTYLISADDIKYQALDDHLPDVLSRLTREYLKETDVGNDDYYDDDRYPCECKYEIYKFGCNSRFCIYVINPFA